VYLPHVVACVCVCARSVHVTWPHVFTKIMTRLHVFNLNFMQLVRSSHSARAADCAFAAESVV
jgi:hypothetical protein